MSYRKRLYAALTVLLLLVALPACTVLPDGSETSRAEGLKIGESYSVTFEAYSDDGSPVDPAGMDDLEAVLRKRLDNAGYPGAKISRSGDDSLNIDLSGADDPQSFEQELIKPMKLEFRVQGSAETALTGDDVASACAGYYRDESTGEMIYAVFLEFSPDGAEKFAAVTALCASTKSDLEILVDGAVVTSSSVGPEYAESGITGGKAQISGPFASLEEVRTFANSLDAGVLRYNLRIVERSLSEAYLPRDSLRRLIISGCAVLLFHIGPILVFLIVLAVRKAKKKKRSCGASPPNENGDG